MTRWIWSGRRWCGPHFANAKLRRKLHSIMRADLRRIFGKANAPNAVVGHVVELPAHT